MEAEGEAEGYEGQRTVLHRGGYVSSTFYSHMKLRMLVAKHLRKINDTTTFPASAIV